MTYPRLSSVRAQRADELSRTQPSSTSAVLQYRSGVRTGPNGANVLEPLEARSLMSVSLDTGGWTVVGPSSDTQVVYVSNSAGSDTNDGRSQSTPVKTIARGRSLMRNGMPDHMLLKRGDVWQESLHGGVAWTLSGRDADEPMLVSSYGDAAGARPELQTGAGRGFDLDGKAVHDVVIKGLHFHAHTRDPDAAGYTGSAAGEIGLRLVGAPQRLLLEDNQVESYAQNVTLSDWNGRPADISFRRNLVLDAYPTASGVKSQGMYVTNSDRVTLEGNLFDHNGWDERVSFATTSMYNHNVYMQNTNTGVVVRDNVFANASSHGVQARAGGEFRDNLFLRNAVGLSFGFVNGGAVKAGGVTGTVDGNVFLDSHDIGGVARGWAVEVNNTTPGANVGIRDNIFAHDTRGTNAAGRLDVGADLTNAADGVGLNDLTVEDNIAYRWHQGFYTAAGFVNGGSGYNGYKNVTVRNNDFQQVVATRMGRHEHAYDPAHGKWSGNRYADSDLSPGVWFQVQGVNKTLDEWRAQVEPAAVAATAGYADPGRTISTYSASLGKEASLGGFLREARQQRQGNFRPAYTSAAAINYVRRGFAEGGVVPGGELAAPTGTVAPAPTPAPAPEPAPAPAPAPDAAAPTVGSYAAAGVTTAGGTSHTFTVTYRDETKINPASVGTGDVQVTGPNAYTQAGTLVSAQASADGLSVTAQYRVTAPGGAWDAADNGTYTLSLRAGEVTDAARNAAPAGTVGTFAANVPAPAPAPAPTGTVPLAPIKLTATAASRTSVRLSFVDQSNLETGFTLQRSNDGGRTWATVATLGSASGNTSTGTYTNGGLTRRTTYQYRVRAFNAAGVSAFTPAVSVTTLR